MKRRVGISLALAVRAAAEAAEPAAVAPAVQTSRITSTPTPVTKPLDLRIGNVRSYMPPAEYRAALGAPDADKNTVVVEARSELLPVAYEKPIPMGPLMPVFWALMHPTQSWRILVPDLNRPPDGPPDVVPPPIFRWGP